MSSPTDDFAEMERRVASLIEEADAPLLRDTDDFPCPMCRTPIPLNAEECYYCGARFDPYEAEAAA
jgi:hypothetical protein